MKTKLLKRSIFFILLGGHSLFSLFICSKSFADTVILKNDKQLKGLVVEQHADRIILSTEKGEIPILARSIKKVLYDDAEQNFLQVGKAYEAEKKYGEALAYYEKALEVNPNLEEARSLASGVRNRFWASSTEGPRSEVETKQILYDSWGTQKPVDELIKAKETAQVRSLKENLGISLAKEGDWIEIDSIDTKKDAWFSGLRNKDRLVSIDGQSLRYLSVDAATKKMLNPRYSNFNLEYERSFKLVKDDAKSNLKKIGLILKLEYQGTVIKFVEKESPAAKAGLKNQDFLMAVNGVATRYTPLKKVVSEIENPSRTETLFLVRRNALLARR